MGFPEVLQNTVQMIKVERVNDRSYFQRGHSLWSPDIIETFFLLAVCCGLTSLAAKHQAAIRSPSPLPVWDEGLWFDIKTKNKGKLSSAMMHLGFSVEAYYISEKVGGMQSQGKMQI